MLLQSIVHFTVTFPSPFTEILYCLSNSDGQGVSTLLVSRMSEEKMLYIVLYMLYMHEASQSSATAGDNVLSRAVANHTAHASHHHAGTRSCSCPRDSLVSDNSKPSLKVAPTDIGCRKRTCCEARNAHRWRKRNTQTHTFVPVRSIVVRALTKEVVNKTWQYEHRC